MSSRSGSGAILVAESTSIEDADSQEEALDG